MAENLNNPQEFGKLYIVATPIGNLEDITLRALETLKGADLIACEDTRVSAKLFARYEIKKPLRSIHHHTSEQKLQEILGELKEGKKVAYVSDAGTPGISDPGNKLVAAAIESEVEVISIPGASSLTALISIAGIDMQKFLFLGFPPHKKGRETFFNEVAESKYPVLYFESPHRIIKNLRLFEEKNQNANVIIGKELTKIFEEVIRGNASECIEYLEQNPSKIKGEFVVIAY